jgi:hypothetical protein
VTVMPGTVEIDLGPLRLKGLLGVPGNAEGLVIFAHGSGSGRLSPRNNRVAAKLRSAGLATLLIDLLTTEEEQERANIFDISLLASRLSFATDWSVAQSETRHLPIGYFGASTGAGAALVAAAVPRSPVAAIVSRGGRPDLAGDALMRVLAPTLSGVSILRSSNSTGWPISGWSHQRNSLLSRVPVTSSKNQASRTRWKAMPSGGSDTIWLHLPAVNRGLGGGEAGGVSGGKPRFDRQRPRLRPCAR